MIVTMLAIVSCAPIKSTSQGLENESFIQILGDKKKYDEGIKIQIDGVKVDFDVEKLRLKPKHKESIITISAGKHKIEITNNANQIIYNRLIFTSSQETKTVKLP